MKTTNCKQCVMEKHCPISGTLRAKLICLDGEGSGMDADAFDKHEVPRWILVVSAVLLVVMFGLGFVIGAGS